MTFWNDGMLIGAPEAGPKIPPIFRSVSSNIATGTTNTIDKPTGTVAGDLLVAVLSIGFPSVATISAPSGWTLLVENATGYSTCIFTKIATSAEPSNYTFNLSSSLPSSGIVMGFEGGLNVEPTPTFSANSSSSTSVAASITAIENGVLLALFIRQSTGSVVTPPSGMTLIINNNYMAVYQMSPSPPGSTGNKTLVWNNSSTVRAILMQLTR